MSFVQLWSIGATAYDGLVQAEGPMNKIIELLTPRRLWKETKGQDMVEYALMAGFITVAVAATFPPVGGSINAIFSKLSSILALAS